MIRIAAAADVHLGAASRGRYGPQLSGLREEADVLLLAGDLTNYGTPEEAAVVVEELAGCGVPVVTVLGNHDHESDQGDKVTEVLEGAGIRVLEGDSLVLDVGGVRLGVAGTKGFGGGFKGASGSDFGEPEMKAFVRHSKALAGQLRDALTSLECDLRVALMHYAPVPETLVGERLEIYPFLGSYYLGEAVDAGGAALALHGHAHAGAEEGMTPGGVPVRNVALAVIRRPYAVYPLDVGAPSLPR